MTKQLLTNSRSTSFKLCRRRHWYEYEIGLRPTVDAKALRMGSAFHEGLHHLRISIGDDEFAMKEALEAVRGCYESLG